MELIVFAKGHPTLSGIHFQKVLNIQADFECDLQYWEEQE